MFGDTHTYRARQLLWAVPLVVLGTVAALWLGAGPSRADSGALYVTYSVDCTFTITDTAGDQVTTIPSGSYQLVIQTPFPFAEGDSAQTPPACAYVEFLLTGPGLGNGLSTDLAEGDAQIEQDTVTLESDSTYTALDENSPGATRYVLTTTGPGTLDQQTAGSSTVTVATTTGRSKSGGNENALGTGPVTTPFRGALTGTVSAAGKLALRKGLKTVSTLKAGRYTLRITDRSKKAGFTLQETKKAAKTITRATFTGKKSLTLDLGAGQWFYYGSLVGRKSFFFVVA